MSIFTVNSELCNKCKICVKECPAKIISIDDETGLPFVDKSLESRCIQCGHCVIHCPAKASNIELLEYEFESKSQFNNIDISLMPSQQQSKTFIESRRSTRQFLKTPVEHEKIMQILNTAKFAPTASNNQFVRWIIVENKETTNKLSNLYTQWLMEQDEKNILDEKSKRNITLIQNGYDPIFRGASQLAIATVPKDYYWYEDATIAITYFELAAHSLSVGTCWGGYIIRAISSCKALRDELGIEENEHVGGLLLFGYPKMPICTVLPPRKKLNITIK